MIIAIDGPAGSGKSTIAKLLGQRLNISYLDTGATYRVLTLAALENDFDLDNECILRDLAAHLDLKIEKDKVYLNGRDVSLAVRTPRIDRNISKIVAYPRVRKEMVDLQRRIAKEGDFVVEGRDITTVVFPRAEFKFYLDADFPVRVQRRFAELKAKGIDIAREEVSKDLEKRDTADKTRKDGPLVVSGDAVYLDTTNLNLEEVIQAIVNHIK